VAVGLCVASSASFAQSNTTGNLFGQVTVPAGATVVVENLATGAKRTLTPDASGRFVASSMPGGTYRVTLMRNGAVVTVVDNVDVTIGQGSEVQFASAGANQTVEVVGKVARIDVSSSSNSSNFTAKQLAALPIAKNLDAIIQLAPNTTRADPRYAGGASMGGGAPSENSYYVNGFPVTNPLSQLGSSELPFGAIGNADISTGGFGAEFGRSTGGVINVTTKSGTNEWEAGIGASITPNSLRSTPRDIYYPNTGQSYNSDTDGKLYRRRSTNTETDYSLGGYIGGPLIKDQLFMFVAVERLNANTKSIVSADDPTPGANRYSSGGFADRHNTNDRYAAKFDWNLTQDHRLELTLLGDKYNQDEKLYGYDYATGMRDNVLSAADKYTNVPNQTLGDGASSQILKYTGYLTDDFTVSVLAGQSTSPHSNTYAAASGFGGPQVFINPGATAPGLTYTNPYPFPAGTTILPDGAEDKVKAMRLDLEYRWGDHTIKGGLDKVELKSKNAGETELGGSLITYYRTSNGNLAPGGGNNIKTLIQGNALTDGTSYFYGRERIFNDATNAGSDQAAQYIQDAWQISKNFLLTGGLRNETYVNKNGDGQTFLKIGRQLNPRLSFAWDVSGDSSLKVYGSAGRYAVQIPTHLAVRGASRSTLTNRYFTYQGVDANGQPTGVVDVSNVYSPDGEFGQAKDANTVAGLNLKPNSQDEMTLGFEKAWSSSLTFGGSFTYRRLNSTIDDFCDQRPFDKYAADHGIDTSNWGGFSCASFNPGKDNSFLIDYAGTAAQTGQYTLVNLSKADLGFGDAKRTYMALNLFAEHPLKDGWYGKVAYTYSKSKGNTEGQTLSDVAQTDVAATQTWDHPEIMEYAYGYLPGDRRHQLKMFGVLQVTPELDVGANVLFAAGRPKNCIGNYGGTSTGFPDYGTAYHYCTFNGVTSPSPRGTAGNLPWDQRMDINLTYKPEAMKGLSLRVDVFNLLNQQTAQAVNELHEIDGDPSTVSSTYGRVLSYTPARSVKLSAQYDYKF
jgi:hypothetical protein